MERLKKMGLRRSFFAVSVLCMAAALLLTYGIYQFCAKLYDRYPHYGIAITPDGAVTALEEPAPDQERIMKCINRIQLLAVLIIPVSGLGLAGILFYHLKLKVPIAILKESTERLRMHQLDFTIPEVSADELGQVCAAFETMRAELLHMNQELWRQAEERRRLNAAFAHDLRNPVTVLKGTVKMLRQGSGGAQALERLETYTLRIEQYVEAMSSIQRLEQMPVCRKAVDLSVLYKDLQETAKVFCTRACGIGHSVGGGSGGSRSWLVSDGCRESDWQCGAFCTAQAGDCAGSRLGKDERRLLLTVQDDGAGYPAALLKDGPKPFGKKHEDPAHFGMGLYSSQLICTKHGGALFLENKADGGAVAKAIFS